MWKALFHYLLLDNCIHKLGIPMTSMCNYCENRDEDTLDCLLSIGNVAKLVWKKATFTMWVFNVESETWKVKNKLLVSLF